MYYRTELDLSAAVKLRGPKSIAHTYTLGSVCFRAHIVDQMTWERLLLLCTGSFKINNFSFNDYFLFGVVIVLCVANNG